MEHKAASPSTRPSGSKPLVSVAVPTYNQAHLLSETLESLVHQDYEALEIVVSDDASSDRTAAIGQNFADRYPGRVIFIQQQHNLGVTGNVRSMEPFLHGEYLCWFAGDDICLPGKISRQVSAMEEFPDAVVCYHDIDVFDHETGRSLYRYNDPRSGQQARSGRIAGELLEHRCFIGAISIMVRQDAAKHVRHRAELPRVSDWLYLIELAHLGEVIYIDDVLARYRRHSNNVTNIVDISDELKTYDLVRGLYPEYKEQADRGEFLLKISYAFRHLTAFDLQKSAGLAREIGRLVMAEPANIPAMIGYVTSLLRQRTALMKQTGRLNR